MKWTDEELQFLIDNYSKYSLRQLGHILHRTQYSICAKVKKLNLRKRGYSTKAFNVWTDEDKQYLKDNINKLSIREIANNLGRTRNAIYSMQQILGVYKDVETDKALACNSREYGIRLLKNKYNLTMADATSRYNKWRQNYLKGGCL